MTNEPCNLLPLHVIISRSLGFSQDTYSTMLISNDKIDDVWKVYAWVDAVFLLYMCTHKISD
jgi:hypothetical protein